MFLSTKATNYFRSNTVSLYALFSFGSLVGTLSPMISMKSILSIRQTNLEYLNCFFCSWYYSTRASNRRRVLAGYRVQKFTKPPTDRSDNRGFETNLQNRLKPVIAKNNCRLYYLRRNSQISKMASVACRFPKPIKFLNRTGFKRPGLEPLYSTIYYIVLYSSTKWVISSHLIPPLIKYISNLCKLTTVAVGCYRYGFL